MLEETRPDGHGRARGLVSSRVSGQRIEARTFAPSTDLRDMVHYYWVTRWDLRDQQPHLAEILADPCVNIVFEATQSRVVGVSTHLFQRKLAGVGLIRAVKLRAGTARALLPDASIALLTDRMTSFGTFFDDTDGDLESHVLSPADDREGLTRLDDWISARVTNADDPKIRLAATVVEHIARDSDVMTAGQAAEWSGLTIRQLQRLFRDYVGVSPKWVIRRHRLQETAVRLERGETASLARLAVELGYSDHAHLSRDFKIATGRSPSDFAREVWK